MESLTNAKLLTLVRAPGMGNATVKKLLRRYGSTEQLWATPRSELSTFPRVRAEALRFLSNAELARSCELLAEWQRAGHSTVFWGSPAYPERLGRLPDPPMMLFHRGSLETLSTPSIAIVGSRQASQHQIEFTRNLAQQLAASGYTVVSGFALGIDTAAHLGALGAGKTVAVLGSGFERIHPRENHTLVSAVERQGCLLTELYPAIPARGRTLMARNRLVVGLSDGALVMAAGEKSGSLDAARRALKLGLPVWAYPGSVGTDGLLGEGCRPLVDCDGILSALKEPGPKELRLF